MQGFKPFGIAVCDTENIFMQYDEYETIKLLNYQMLSQNEAAESMEISQPTLTRIYNSALIKIASAFVEGKSIVIDGGNFELDKEWYKCKKCFKLIEGLENHIKCKGCDKFGKDELVKINLT
jgi:predicted DNA-binding protein (UPF0251 family)